MIKFGKKNLHNKICKIKSLIIKFKVKQTKKVEEAYVGWADAWLSFAHALL